MVEYQKLQKVGVVKFLLLSYSWGRYTFIRFTIGLLVMMYFQLQQWQ